MAEKERMYMVLQIFEKDSDRYKVLANSLYDATEKPMEKNGATTLAVRVQQMKSTIEQPKRMQRAR